MARMVCLSAERTVRRRSMEMGVRISPNPLVSSEWEWQVSEKKKNHADGASRAAVTADVYIC